MTREDRPDTPGTPAVNEETPEETRDEASPEADLREPFELDEAPTDEELAAAAALARALEGDDRSAEGDGAELASFAEALRNAYAPPALAADRLDAIVEGALDNAMPRQRGRVIRVVFGGSAAVLAMAAAAALFLQLGERNDSASSIAAAPALTAPRSAQDLFDEPFPRTGGTSERVDRIASARERELRANRYAAWGVR